jgi:phage shock protein PspC (stress-responsive transcriptional regulator)
MEQTPELPAPPPPPPPADADPAHPRRLTRTSADRMLGGVCGGIGRYFGIDSTLVRIGFVALALLGGTGLIVYAAALLLVPLDNAAASGLSSSSAAPRDRNMAIGLLIAFVVVGLSLGGFGLGFGGALVPLGFIALAGLAVWWLVSGERPSGSPASVVRRAAQGVGLLIGCFALAVASFFASGLGGGVAVAAIVIAAGAGLVAAAFVGGARWLVLPALAIALPLAFVSAAHIDLDGGFGERHERPGTLSELKPGYRLGAGELVIDLRDVRLPAGDHPLKVRIGAGHAQVIVDEGVCVATRAQIGVGAVEIFDRDGGGVDVDWSDTRRAPKDTPRIVIDGDVGIGFLDVRHTAGTVHRGAGLDPNREQERNSACVTT